MIIQALSSVDVSIYTPETQHSVAYVNSEHDRKKFLTEGYPQEIIDTVMDVWGDKSIVIPVGSPPSETVEPQPDYIAFLRGLMGVE